MTLLLEYSAPAHQDQNLSGTRVVPQQGGDYMMLPNGLEAARLHPVVRLDEDWPE